MAPKTMLMLESKLHDFGKLLLFSNRIYFHMESHWRATWSINQFYASQQNPLFRFVMLSVIINLGLSVLFLFRSTIKRGPLYELLI